MPKYLICKADDHMAMGMYEADSVNIHAMTSDDVEVIHCLVMPGADPTYCNIVNDGGVWKATPKVDVQLIKQELLKRIDFAIGLIAEFSAENQMLGISVEQTTAVFGAMSGIILAMQVGALETAISMIKAMPDEAMDGVIFSKARLLVYVNKCESFMGVPLSGAW